MAEPVGKISGFRLGLGIGCAFMCALLLFGFMITLGPSACLTLITRGAIDVEKKVPAAPVRPLVQRAPSETVTVSEPRQPQPEKSWSVIKQWEGDADIRNTEPFTVGDRWCVDWNMVRTSELDSPFSISVAGISHGYNVITSGDAPDAGLSYQYKAGNYYLDIRTCGPYVVRVLELR